MKTEKDIRNRISNIERAILSNNKAINDLMTSEDEEEWLEEDNDKLRARIKILEWVIK